MLEFLRTIILFLNNNNIEYMLSGSIALGVYTLPRATRDFDFIVQIEKEDGDNFAKHFDVGYYCHKDAVIDAINQESMFNK